MNIRRKVVRGGALCYLACYTVLQYYRVLLILMRRCYCCLLSKIRYRFFRTMLKFWLPSGATWGITMPVRPNASAWLDKNNAYCSPVAIILFFLTLRPSRFTSFCLRIGRGETKRCSSTCSQPRATIEVERFGRNIFLLDGAPQLLLYVTNTNIVGMPMNTVD